MRRTAVIDTLGTRVECASISLSAHVQPPVQLTVLIGLARTSQSRAARVCLTRGCQWLGKVSMALYLVHMPVYHWLALAVNGPAEWAAPGVPESCRHLKDVETQHVLGRRLGALVARLMRHSPPRDRDQ